MINRYSMEINRVNVTQHARSSEYCLDIGYSIKESNQNEFVNKAIYLQLPKGYKLTFGGSTLEDIVFRFYIINPDNKKISIFLDYNDNFALIGKPYWEVFVLEKEDSEPQRCLMNETDELIEIIKNI